MPVRTDIWNQFGANPAGSGFRLVNTTNVTDLRMLVDLPGPVGTGSPVFGPDGTLYVGTSNGHLLAIDLRSSSPLKWNVGIPGFGMALQTPGVADDGIIYLLCNSLVGVRDHRTSETRGAPSFVVAVNPDGTIRWRRPIPTQSDRIGPVN